MDKFVELTQRSLAQATMFFREQPRLSLALGMLIVVLAVLSSIKWVDNSPPQTSTAIQLAVDSTSSYNANLPLAEPRSDYYLSSSTPNWQTITIRKGSNLASIFQNLGINASELIAIQKLGQIVDPLKNLRPGQPLQIALTPDHQLSELALEINHTQKLVIERDATHNSYKARIEALPLEQKLNFVHGVIRHSYYQTAADAGLTPQQIHQLSQAFNTMINFRQLQPGDRFSALYEGYYSKGDLIRKGNIVAAEFTHQGNTYKVIRFSYPKDHTSYYTSEGKNTQLAINRAPLHYTRISSYFGLRPHPILHFIRPHEGVDYAAPVGTPIKAAGNGVITYIGRKGGYGRVVFIQHDSKYSTRYAHLSRYAAGLKRGSRVQAGQVIGYVGLSGLSTGPHLHFEIRVHGKAQNPLTVALPDAQPIPKQFAQEFRNRANQLLSILATHTEALNRNA